MLHVEADWNSDDPFIRVPYTMYVNYRNDPEVRDYYGFVWYLEIIWLRGSVTFYWE